MLAQIDIVTRLLNALELEGYVFGSLLFLVCLLGVKTWLRNLSASRIKIFVEVSRLALRLELISVGFVLAFRSVADVLGHRSELISVVAFLGFVALLFFFSWLVTLIRFFSLTTFFTLSPKRPVPMVLTNVVTFLLSSGILLLLVKLVFGVSVTPLLATSAVLSLVLGLALQDTLGNLITGIALQIDKPFRIGDWVEMQGNGLKTTGKVLEITWRATVLQSFTEETLVIPNRLVAQSQISNFSLPANPALRGVMFRLPFGSPIPEIKHEFLKELSSVPQILDNPEPVCLLIENGDSWVNMKVLYALEDFGKQFVVGDLVLSKCHGALLRLGVKPAMPSFLITSQPT